MNRWLSIPLACLLLLPAFVHAQVAVPGFSPGAPSLLLPGGAIPSRSTFTTLNPAAMQWGAPSRFGAGIIDGTYDNKVTDETADISGNFGGLRYVMDQGSIGLETTQLRSDSSSFDFSESSTELGVAGAVADFLTLGLQVSQEKRDFTVTEQETQSRTLGLSMAFGELIYVGLAVEEQDLSFTFAGSTTDYSRQNTMAGVGLRSGGGTLLWHAEVYQVTRVDYDNDSGSDFGGRDLVAAVLELNWNDLLVGFAQTQVDHLDSDASEQSDRLDVGWAPQEGLAIAGRIERGSYDDGTDTTRESDVTSVAVSYLF